MTKPEDVDPTFIRLEVGEGAVSLTGKVSSLEEKRAALQAVQRVPGVKAVADDREVREPGCGYRTDAEIAKDIAHARIFEAYRAARIIAQMNGVRAVSNLVTFQRVADMEPRG